VEQRIRNAQVVSSSLMSGSKKDQQSLILFCMPRIFLWQLIRCISMHYHIVVVRFLNEGYTASA
ncbi:MAG: hypothetical protein J6X99_02900, partial [Bacteroidales bacterium]|nr:hypothetical protein [Bacteroidales bacterium]